MQSSKPNDNENPIPEPHEDLLSPLEVCEMVGISLSTLKRLRRSDNFPVPIALGERVRRWKRDELEEWLTIQRPGNIKR
nr:helix-turn-helix domain-containing protein [Novosphingobium silvae]